MAQRALSDQQCLSVREQWIEGCGSSLQWPGAAQHQRGCGCGAARAGGCSSRQCNSSKGEYGSLQQATTGCSAPTRLHACGAAHAEGLWPVVRGLASAAQHVQEAEVAAWRAHLPLRPVRPGRGSGHQHKHIRSELAAKCWKAAAVRQQPGTFELSTDEAARLWRTLRECAAWKSGRRTVTAKCGNSSSSSSSKPGLVHRYRGGHAQAAQAAQQCHSLASNRCTQAMAQQQPSLRLACRHGADSQHRKQLLQCQASSRELAWDVQFVWPTLGLMEPAHLSSAWHV